MCSGRGLLGNNTTSGRGNRGISRTAIDEEDAIVIRRETVAFHIGAGWLSKPNSYIQLDILLILPSHGIPQLVTNLFSEYRQDFRVVILYTY